MFRRNTRCNMQVILRENRHKDTRRLEAQRCTNMHHLWKGYIIYTVETWAAFEKLIQICTNMHWDLNVAKTHPNTEFGLSNGENTQNKDELLGIRKHYGRKWYMGIYHKLLFHNYKWIFLNTSLKWVNIRLPF